MQINSSIIPVPKYLQISPCDSWDILQCVTEKLGHYYFYDYFGNYRRVWI